MFPIKTTEAILVATDFLCQNIYRCTPEAKELTYTSSVCPLMEFGAPAWDSYRVKDINKIEMVQYCAARFAKSDYRRTTSVSKVMDDLGWRTLSDHRKDASLNLFGKAACGKVAIPVASNLFF